MSFITRVRELAGSRPIIQVGCGAYIFNDRSELLLCRRTDDGTWDLPGGGLEFEETIAETAIREVFEETNLRIRSLGKRHVFSGPNMFDVNPFGNAGYLICVVHEVTEYDGEIVLDLNEHTEFQWFSLTDLPHEINNITRELLAPFLGKLPERKLPESLVGGDYIMDMRKAVGHIPLLMVGSAVILPNEAGKVLSVHRCDTKSWALPGGALNLGETLEQCAAREVLEETGLSVEALNLVDIYSGKDYYCQYPNGDEVYNVVFLYEVTKWQGEVNLDPDEHDEWNFVDPENPPEPMWSVIRSYIKDYAGYRINVR